LDAAQNGKLVVAHVQVLQLYHRQHFVGNFRDQIKTQVDELERANLINILYFPYFIMGEIEDLQMGGGGNVGGNAANVVMAIVELADAEGRGQVGYLLDFKIVCVIASGISGKMVGHY
jgi:hypothetical protein